MRVRKPVIVTSAGATGEAEEKPSFPTENRSYSEEPTVHPTLPSDNDVEKSGVTAMTTEHGFLDFSNSRIMVCLAYAIWCVILAANMYAIVMLVMKVVK